MSRSLIWFRGSDLRVHDQAALREAAKADAMLAVFFVPVEEGREAHDRFLRESVACLQDAMARRGGRLDLLDADPAESIPALVSEFSIDAVHAIAGTLPADREIDRALSSQIGDRLHLHPGHTLAEPGSVRSGSGEPYSVFTPFARRFRASITVGRPVAAPGKLPAPPAVLEARRPDFGPKPGDSRHPGGEDAGRIRLGRLGELAPEYATARDRMDIDGTSRLSADLKFGTVSPREVWHAAAEESFRNELIWREFNYTIAATRPSVLTEPFRPSWRGFPWRDDERDWLAWRDGRTGYPVVDASARQLLAEGFVHNRARMVSASFLTKHLLIDYSRGEEHYLTHLVDGDPAQNNAGWQWSAGCGCDAQPWFRIFNPVLQGKRFDPDGDYVRRWVPELARVPARWIHEPWRAPARVLEDAGVRPGVDYPHPVIDHAAARERFLATAKSHLG